MSPTHDTDVSPDGWSDIDYLTDSDEGRLAARCCDCDSQVDVIDMYGDRYLVQVDFETEGAYDWGEFSVRRYGRRKARKMAFDGAETAMNVHRRLKH